MLAGAQWRLLCPMASGAVAVMLVVLRVVGPHLVELPRWLSLGVAGALLIAAGATWEKRLREVRIAADRMRPMVAALR